MTTQDVPDAAEISRKAKRFLLLFANFGGNLGDVLIAESTVEWLTRLHPGCAIHIHVQDARRNPALQKSFLDRHPNVTFLPPTEISITPAEPESMYQGLLEKIGQHEIAAVFSGMDAIICLGGGHWAGIERPIFMAALIEVAARQCRNVGFMPHSLPPAIEPQLAPIIGHGLNKLKTICVRDPLSLRIARTLGVGNAILLPDSAFLTSRAFPPRQEHNSEPHIVLALRHNTNGTSDPSWWHDLSKAGNAITRKGASIKLLSTYAAQDQPLTTALQDLLGFESHCIDDLDGVFTTISQSDVVISDRLHVLIIATILGVPIIPVLTLGKVAGYVEYIGWDIFVQSAAQLDWEKHIEPLLRDWAVRHQRMRSFADLAKTTLETALETAYS